MTVAHRFIGLLPYGAPRDARASEIGARDGAQVVLHRMPAPGNDTLDVLLADIARSPLETVILFPATHVDDFAAGSFDALAKMFAMKPRLDLVLAPRTVRPTLGHDAFAAKQVEDPDLVPSLLARHLPFIRARAVFQVLEARPANVDPRQDLALVAAMTARETVILPRIQVSAQGGIPGAGAIWRAERRLLQHTGADAFERLAHKLAGLRHLAFGRLKPGQWLEAGEIF